MSEWLEHRSKEGSIGGAIQRDSKTRQPEEGAHGRYKHSGSILSKIGVKIGFELRSTIDWLQVPQDHSYCCAGNSS